MKYLFCLTILLPLILLGQQDTVITYFDNDWKKVSIKKYTYFRKSYKKNKLWYVQDHYKSGTLQMKGTYLDKSLKKKHGNFQYFSEEDEKYSEHNYKKGKKDGLRIRYNKSLVPFSKETYKKGKLDGISYWYHPNSNISSKEIYRKNKRQEFTFYDESGVELKGDYPYEQMPEYPNGFKEGLMKDIKENTRYPQSAVDNNVQGRVLIKFVIDRDGFVTEVENKNDVHWILNKEAIRVVKSLKRWSPGKRHNLPVRVQYTIPVNFKINDPEKRIY